MKVKKICSLGRKKVDCIQIQFKNDENPLLMRIQLILPMVLSVSFKYNTIYNIWLTRKSEIVYSESLHITKGDPFAILFGFNVVVHFSVFLSFGNGNSQKAKINKTNFKPLMNMLKPNSHLSFSHDQPSGCTRWPFVSTCSEIVLSVASGTKCPADSRVDLF